jgi:hypothetical protein
MNAPADLNQCKNGGYCVSAKEWLPAEPFDFDWVQLSPIVGCNRLHCGDCNVEVRSLVGFELGSGLSENEVYALVEAGDTSRFTPSPASRIYACRHFNTVAKQFFRAVAENDYDPFTPWSCGGHPQLTLPAVLEGVAVDERSDWSELARRSFAGTLGVSLHPSVDREFGFWLQRLCRLVGLPVAAEIARAAAAQVLDPDPRVRLGAIVFFRLGWNAPGAELMAPALRDHPELFADVLVAPDPITLERQLLDMLSYRIANQLNDQVAIEEMRKALSRKFTPLGMQQSLYSMAEVDQKWLLANGDQIVAKVPELWPSVRNALEAAGAPKGELAQLVMRVQAARIA